MCVELLISRQSGAIFPSYFWINLVGKLCPFGTHEQKERSLRCLHVLFHSYQVAFHSGGIPCDLIGTWLLVTAVLYALFPFTVQYYVIPKILSETRLAEHKKCFRKIISTITVFSNKNAKDFICHVTIWETFKIFILNECSQKKNKFMFY